MPTAEIFQTNFTAGELTPRLDGHVDFDKYANGAKTIRNFIIQPQGGVTRRPGTVYVADVKDSSKQPRLIPFIFTQGDAYALEFGDLYVRFYQNRAQVLDGGPPLEVVTTYTEAQLRSIKYAQSADVMYFAHPTHHPRKLVRSGPTTWAISDIDFLDGPYLKVNTTETTLTPSAITGDGITITASSEEGINDGDGFKASDVGRLVRIKNGSEWGYAKIVGHTSSLIVTADVKADFAATTATVTWAIGAWSVTTGYPGAVVLHQQRLGFAGNANQPSTVWLSRSGDFENMAPTQLDDTVLADDAVVYTIASSEVNIIRWMISGRSLFAGGNGEVVRITGGDTSGAISATSVPEIRPAFTLGVDPIATPLRVGDDVLFVQRGARKLRAMRFLFESDDFSAPDATLLAEHISQGKFVETAYADEPFSQFWGVKGTGELVGMTFNREEKIAAWSRHTPGGSFSGGDAVVDSVAVIPAATYDQAWLVVKRTIDGATKRFVEFMEAAYDTTTDQDDAHYVDAGVKYDGVPTATVTGLDHLEGETVQILTDGATHPPQPVVSGQVTLEQEASVVITGLGYDKKTELQTIRLVVPRRIDGIQGRKIKPTQVVMRLFETGSLFFGSDAAALDEALIRDPAAPVNAAVPLFTGDLVEAWPGGHSIESRGIFHANGPQPCTILAVGFHVDVADRV